MWNYLYLVVCLIFAIALFVFLKIKPRVNSFENKLFTYSLYANIISVLCELILQFFTLKIGLENIFTLILSRAYLISIFAWFTIFSKYIFYIFKPDKKEENYEYLFSKFQKKYALSNIIHNTFLGVSCFLSIILPLKYYINGTEMYSYGPAVDYLRVGLGLFMFSWVLISFINFKKIFKPKYIPILIIVVLLLLNILLQKINPSLLIVSFTLTFLNYILFFTIENPDIRLIEYEKKEKELAISANEAKSAFLSSMSHELRTPLNAIVGLSEDMLSFQDQVPSEVKEDCHDIVNASNTLLEIIGNILDISKIEGGKLELIESDYLPKEEIESLLKIMRTKVEEKDLQLNVFIDPNIPECLFGDRLRIKQIINNFLSNAIKYTEKGYIDFTVRWINNSLEIKVADTGRGIKPEDKDKLFEKFERLHVEKTSSVQGTGLGLAITKSLVELMGGTINVDSVYGQGSTFWVVIPQKPGNKDNIVREALSVEEKHEVDFTGKKILVVDDNKLNIKVLRKAIASFNFEIDECYDGQTAIDMINAGHYDIVLMDIMMPVMGGEEAMGILKQNPAFTTPVIALTADATTGAKERYMACGFVDYLAKPFSRDVIATKLENVLKDTK